jgi:type IX secretion system PorP/SprF family membrane protein
LIRNQWTGMPGTPKTSEVALHGTLKNEKVALGFNAYTDEIGFTKTGAMLGTYAYRILMPNSTLSFGLGLGFANTAYNWAAVDIKDKADVLYGTGLTNMFHTLADAGVYYHNNTFYAGLSTTNLLSPKTTANNYSQLLVPHLFLTVGKSFALSDNIVLNPSVLVKMVQGAPLGLDINCNVLVVGKLWLGLSYRLNYGIVFVTQYNITEKFKIGYAYDWGLNDIGSAGGPSHEIMLGYNFSMFNRKMQSFRYL